MKTKFPKLRLSFLAATVLVLAPGFALGSGFINPSTGGRASSMAGAWMAQGDDLSVMDHNPAQLIRQDRYGLEFHYTAFVFDAYFDPTPVEGIGDGPSSGNTANFVNHIPNFYAVFPVHERVKLGAGLFTPVGPRHTYGDDGTQRYQMQQAQISLVWGTVAAAVRLLDQLTASISLDIAYPWATQKLALGLVPGFRTLDGSLTVDGAGKPTPRGKFGLLVEPADDWSIGLVAAHGIDLSIEGEVRADLPQAGLDPATAVDNVVATQRYPTEARLGVGWTPGDWRAELAMRWYRWSEYEEQAIDLQRNVIGGFPIADLTVKKYYEDTFAIQAGGGVRLAEIHEIRAGYAYDRRANQSAGVTINDYDADKHILGLGYGVQIKERFTFDIGFNHLIYVDQTVTDSQSAPIAILGGPEGMGNGAYDWSVQTIAVSAGARF